MREDTSAASLIPWAWIRSHWSGEYDSSHGPPEARRLGHEPGQVGDGGLAACGGRRYTVEWVLGADFLVDASLFSVNR